MATGYSHLVVLSCHVTLFVCYAAALTYDTFYMQFAPHRKSFGGRFKFLTFWNEVIQTVYFGYSIINDIFGSNVDRLTQEKQKSDNRSRLQRIRDFAASTIVFPLGLFVVVTFWGIFLYDREKIFPAALDKLIPSWLNHMWHTNVLPFLIIDKLVVYHKYPGNVCGLSTAFMFGVVYQVWMFWIKYQADIWVYPLFEFMSWWQIGVFLIGCWVLLVAFYFVGQFATSIIWPSAPSVPADKKKA